MFPTFVSPLLLIAFTQEQETNLGLMGRKGSSTRRVMHGREVDLLGGNDAMGA